ncbi:M48 family metallopeptidase [candidate division KSB1 bacterium]|nr:M48 family metallopeptidase [candidate division KSB1 bacterium]
MHSIAMVILIAYLITASARYFLKFLNLSYLKKYGNQIPASFEGQIDQDLLQRTMAYTIEHSRFGVIVAIFSDLLLLIFIFAGLLNWYQNWVLGWGWSFILTGVAFFLILSYVETILDIPFDLYTTFKIENKYGFNVQTPKLWMTDFVKSWLISTLLAIIVGSGMFGLIQFSAEWWWLLVWAFIFIFSLIMMYLTPYIIEPLFNKYEPLKVEGLEADIKALMQKAGIRVSQVLQMDASRRSKHSNAYFTGIGKTKRIVLFDTLLEKLSPSEILAVLAHEAGHWKKKHIFKAIFWFEIFSLVSLFITHHILHYDLIFTIFGIKAPAIFAGLILIGFVGGILSFPFIPLKNYFSRRREYEADRFACELTGDSTPLITALVKLSKDNLANLHPHPWFARFYYAHPPIVERLQTLQKFSVQEQSA